MKRQFPRVMDVTGPKRLKSSLRELGRARLVANRLLDALVDLADVARGQRVGENDFRLGDVPRGLHGALVRMSQAIVPDVHTPPLPWQLPALKV